MAVNCIVKLSVLAHDSASAVYSLPHMTQSRMMHSQCLAALCVHVTA